MKALGYIIVLLFACYLPCPAQEDSLKDFSNHSVYSDPHDTDMDKMVLQQDAGKKYRDLIGKPLIYDFGDFGFEVIFKSDTLLYWKSLKTEYEETDISKTLLIDPYSVLTAWVELDHSFVSLYSNFNKKKASFFIRSQDGSYEGYSGVIKVK